MKPQTNPETPLTVTTFPEQFNFLTAQPQPQQQAITQITTTTPSHSPENHTHDPTAPSETLLLVSFFVGVSALAACSTTWLWLHEAIITKLRSQHKARKAVYFCSVVLFPILLAVLTEMIDFSKLLELRAVNVTGFFQLTTFLLVFVAQGACWFALTCTEAQSADEEANLKRLLSDEKQRTQEEKKRTGEVLTQQAYTQSLRDFLRAYIQANCLVLKTKIEQLQAPHATSPEVQSYPDEIFTANSQLLLRSICNTANTLAPDNVPTQRGPATTAAMFQYADSELKLMHAYGPGVRFVTSYSETHQTWFKDNLDPSKTSAANHAIKGDDIVIIPDCQKSAADPSSIFKSFDLSDNAKQNLASILIMPVRIDSNTQYCLCITSHINNYFTDLDYHKREYYNLREDFRDRIQLLLWQRQLLQTILRHPGPDEPDFDDDDQ